MNRSASTSTERADGCKCRERQLHNPLRHALAEGSAPYRGFNRFDPSQVTQVKHRRLMPPVVVELGRLAGLIYCSDKGQPGRARTYIHLMQEPPRLVSNMEGTQLYIVGGNYRVGRRGIEG